MSETCPTCQQSLPDPNARTIYAARIANPRRSRVQELVDDPEGFRERAYREAREAVNESLRRRNA